MKYWDTPIIIVERERFWETAGVHFLSNIISLLGQRETAFSSFFFVAQEAGMGTISTGAAVDSGTALANNSAIHDYVNGYLFSTLFVITGYVYIHEIYQVHL